MIHPLSIVDPQAKLGKDVTVSQFSTIEADVEIGNNTWIGPNVTIMSGSRIGKNCQIFPGAVVGAIPQDLKFAGEYSTAVIGDHTILREYVTVNRGTQSKGTTIIGNHTLLMAYCHVGHDCVIGNHIIVSNATQFAGEVIVDDFAIISGGCLVHQFSHIGSYVMIQGGSKISQDIPPFALVGRDPVRFVGINSVGLQRRGFTIPQFEIIQNCYRYIYQKRLNVSNAIAKAEKEIPDSPEKSLILDFIKNSSRGIVRSATR